jgi:hypothetical protein
MSFHETAYKFDNATYNTDTWYKHTFLNDTINVIVIKNNGVKNDGLTGLLYLTYRTDDAAETKSITDAGIRVLKPGDEVTKSVSSDMRVNIQANKLNMCVIIEERSQEDKVSLVSNV